MVISSLRYLLMEHPSSSVSLFTLVPLITLYQFRTFILDDILKSHSQITFLNHILSKYSPSIPHLYRHCTFSSLFVDIVLFVRQGYW